MRPATIARYLLAIIIIGALIAYVGPGQIAEQLASANPWWVLASMLFLLLTFLPGAMGLIVLIQPLHKTIATRTMAAYYAITWALGTILPGRLGSLAIIPLLKREGINLGPGAALFLLDKFITLGVIVLVSLAGIVLLFGSAAGALGVLIALIGLLAAGALFYLPIGRRLIRALLLKRFSQNFTGFAATSKAYITTHRSAVARNTLWTIVKLALDSMVLWTMFQAVGTSVPFIAVMVIYAASAILSNVPLTLNGLGFRESAAIVFYTQLGVQASTVLAVHLLIYAMNALLSGIIVLWFLRAWHMRFADLFNLSKN